MMIPKYAVIPFLLYAQIGYSQILAGVIPADRSVVALELDLIVAEAFSDTSALFDVDCDGIPDMRAFLYRGMPPVDVPHYCTLQLLDSTISICSDTSSMFWRPRYSGFGEELTCSDPYTLRNDSVVTLGDLGSFLAMGPSVLDSAYVAFTMNGLTAWLRISFVLGSGIDVVRLQIHEVLTACATTSIPLSDLAPAPILFPNPSDGRDLQIAQGTVARSIRISDATGRVVAAYSGPRQTIPCPSTPGVYFISVLSSDERTTVVRLLRN